MSESEKKEEFKYTGRNYPLGALNPKEVMKKTFAVVVSLIVVGVVACDMTSGIKSTAASRNWEKANKCFEMGKKKNLQVIKKWEQGDFVYREGVFGYQQRMIEEIEILDQVKKCLDSFEPEDW